MGQLLFTFLKIDCATNVMTMLMSKLYRAEVILQINTLSAAQRSILKIYFHPLSSFSFPLYLMGHRQTLNQSELFMCERTNMRWH